VLPPGRQIPRATSRVVRGPQKTSETGRSPTNHFLNPPVAKKKRFFLFVFLGAEGAKGCANPIRLSFLQDGNLMFEAAFPTPAQFAPKVAAGRFLVRLSEGFTSSAIARALALRSEPCYLEKGRRDIGKRWRNGFCMAGYLLDLGIASMPIRNVERYLGSEGGLRRGRLGPVGKSSEGCVAGGGLRVRSLGQWLG